MKNINNIIIISISMIIGISVYASEYREKFDYSETTCKGGEVKISITVCIKGGKEAHLLKVRHIPSNTVLIISTPKVSGDKSLDGIICRYLAKNKFSSEGIKHHLTSMGINFDILLPEKAINICSGFEEFPEKVFKTEL